MPFNGSGTYTLPYNWNNDAANNINITASRMQAQDQDEATALSDCVTRDGQSPWTANMPAGGFKITNLAVGSASNDSVTFGQTLVLSGANQMTGSFLPVTGTTSLAPITLTAGTNLSAAAAGSMEFDGTHLYVTDSVPTRNTIAWTSSNITGSAAKLTTARSIAMSGDATWTVNFDGSGNVTAAGTLATVNSNVGSFTNASVTVNGKGLVTAASSGATPLIASNNLSDVTAATAKTNLGIQKFTSNDQTIAASTSVAVNHSLSGLPLSVTLYFVCQSSEIGFNTGDIVQVNPATSTDGNSNRGLAVVVTTSTITVYFSSGPYDLINPSSFGTNSINSTKWKLRIIATYF